ncbi:hypothetical protein, variant [Aphanomyces invadans]|uniref:Uncharacterized protein n=1 Tax=Aphanomyces invadans TaxID=157072 RepID=A0A024TGU7_9STRA|nr:hypothetical protein, variant [Aphanomyces invadans]ETV92567.1 hypothetical protein, variant [Aphanomyces invadans]|eukprot:XP_008878874.1 hypothetical protein, variant [Aphanomyces invadans]
MLGSDMTGWRRGASTADLRHKPPIDVMIDNASNHLQSHPQDRTADHPSNDPIQRMAYDDDQHMENFPLVPLDVIPRMSTSRLNECRVQLVKLADSLTPDHPDDVALGHYIRKQLATVVTELEDRRAKQRIADLLAGNAVAPRPPVVFAASPDGRSKSCHAMQTPPSHPNAAPTTKHHPAPSSPPHSVYPSKLSLRDMKSLAKATKVTATTDGAKFIILGTNTSKKKRRRKAKAAPVVSAEELLKKQREDRRRAAHDRLLARQAKIALKKQQDQAKKAAAAVAAAASEPANDDSSESDNDVNDVAPSSSDEEYVDADSAAPAHKEIEAAGHPCADVPDAGKPAVDPAVDGDERIRRINAQLCLVQAEDNLRALRSCTPRTATHVPTQEAAASPLQPEPNVALDLRCQPETHERVPEAPDTSSQPRPHEIHEADVTHRKPEAAAGSTPDDSSDDASDGGGGDDDVMASPPCETAYDRSSFHTTVYLVMKDESPTAAPPTASLPEWFQDQRNLISHITDEPSDATKPDRLEGGANGTRFTCSDAPAIPPTSRGDTTAAATDASAADRARTIMSNLMRDRSCIQLCQASVDCALESLSTPSACPVATEAHTTRGANKSQRPRSCHRASGPHLPLAKGQSADSARPQRPSRHQSAKGPPTAPVVMPLVKMPSKPVTDYSSIYRNFYCTMTSFYERMKAAQEHSGKTHTKDIIQNGDVAIRFQLKLYTVWTNIMHDYATVFGVHGMRLTACAIDIADGFDRRAPQDVAPDRLVVCLRCQVHAVHGAVPHPFASEARSRRHRRRGAPKASRLGRTPRRLGAQHDMEPPMDVEQAPRRRTPSVPSMNRSC